MYVYIYIYIYIYIYKYIQRAAAHGRPGVQGVRVHGRPADDIML